MLIKKLQGRKPVEFREIVIEPITDFTYLVAAPTWTLEEGFNILATFKHKGDSEKGAEKSYRDTWQVCSKTAITTIQECELKSNSFLICCDVMPSDNPDDFLINLHESKIRPDKFIHWAREVSLPVPEDFYNKVMKAKAARPQTSADIEQSSLSAKEKRELGRLRREQENFDLAIKATITAIRYCLEKGQRVKRKDLFDLLTRGKDAVSKELFERILPLIPKEFRCKAGNPGKETEET